MSTVGAAAGALVVATAGCGTRMLDPKGVEAERVAGIWWLMFAMAAAIYAVVLVLLFVALRARRSDQPADDDTEREATTHRAVGRPMILAGGVVVPGIVMVVLLVVTVAAADDLRSGGADDALEVVVTGHQYWWDVRYPDDGIRTANEVHLPVDRDVVLVLRSEDVIHSLSVPQIAGKLDLVPGRENRMSVRVTEPGRYDGYCAEFCGLQHARMRFTLIAHEPDDFDRWASAAAREPALPAQGTSEFEGWQVFFSVGCSYCHRVAGSPASSEEGPDLTNLARRDRLAAGLLDNNRGNLGGWILDPQALKPGNRMPGTELDPADLDPLLDFLESLG